MDGGLGKGLGRIRRTASPVSAAARLSHRLDVAHEHLCAAQAATDLDSCRRHTEVALDTAIRIMADEASTEPQRRTAFDYVQQAHTLRAHADTLPASSSGSDDSSKQ